MLQAQTQPPTFSLERPSRVSTTNRTSPVVRPRVHQKSSDGSSPGVDLATYRVAKDPGLLQAQIVQAIVSGVSARGVKEIKPNSPGVEKTNVFRLSQEARAFYKLI